MGDVDREALIVKIMRAADTGLISRADRDLRIDQVRRSGSDAELRAIEIEIDRLASFRRPPVPAAALNPLPGLSNRLAPDDNSRLATLGPILLLMVAVMALAITLSYYAMRSVMEIGGACASGGPYVPVQPCPDNAWMIGPAIPVMIVVAMVGTGVAVAIKAPNLLVPMWGGLFGALGWNFLDFAFQDGETVVGWLVCGIVFWLMALPAVALVIGGEVFRAKRPHDGQVPLRVWWLAYAVASAVGIWCGNWIWTHAS